MLTHRTNSSKRLPPNRFRVAFCTSSTDRTSNHMHVYDPGNRQSPIMQKFRTILTSALAGGALLFTPVSAGADPTDIFDPVLDSTCSFDQIDAALRATAPEVAARLDAMPDQKAQLRGLYDLPVEQRRSAVDAYLAGDPNLRARAEQVANSPDAAQARSVVQQVADTCHSF